MKEFVSNQYNFSRKETFRRAFKITDRIQKRMNANIDIIINFPEKAERKKNKWSFLATFDGYPNNINKSKIEILISSVDEMKKCHKLRRWNAALIITTIHELCHWLVFKEMSIIERKSSNACYAKAGVWEHIEEVHTWVNTLRWLRKLRYHRSPMIVEELQKFVFPKTFKPGEPFIQKKKNVVSQPQLVTAGDF